MWNDFKSFLVKQNAMALAIGVIIGVALNDVVKGIVDDLIMPVVGAAAPGGAWRTAAVEIGQVRLLVGDLASRVLNFLIVAVVAWQLGKWLIKPGPAAPAKTCQFCRMSIDPAATRCAFCTSQLAI